MLILNLHVLFISRGEGYNDIANRLAECQYELTDRLAYYLCGKKPGNQIFYFIENSKCQN